MPQKPTPIPTHHLPDEAPVAIRVDHIRKVKREVQNEVHRHDFHELFFFKEGVGDHMIDLRNFKIKTPCMHIVGPGQVHQVARSKDTIGTVIMFSPDVDLGLGHTAKRAIFRPDNPAVCPLTKERMSTAIDLVAQLENELKNSQATTAAAYLGILLVKCESWYEQQGTSDSSNDPQDLVTRFQQRLEEHFKVDRKVSSYAAALNISAGHLNELAKTRLGKSASMLIQQRTLLEAKRMLLHSNLSIKEISYELNMDDPAYFTRMFKRLAGATPQQFRADIREKYK